VERYVFRPAQPFQLFVVEVVQADDEDVLGQRSGRGGLTAPPPYFVNYNRQLESGARVRSPPAASYRIHSVLSEFSAA
jgi:hypothetical protein